ncbi:MAG TPA: hemerythrin family protein [Bryobacteraceae bacterium]|nr:hemerythrin family protein [Bryobacteraceae bacterium]
MPNLKWSVSHAVFVPDIDDEHQEIFAAVADLKSVLAAHGDAVASMKHLTSYIVDHFAHEERLMRAARYQSLRWHKQQHEGARRRIAQFAALIESGDRDAGPALVEYLTAWLTAHTRLADRMMGSFLRNRRLGLWKTTFQAGTKPIDAGNWVDSKGRAFRARVSP